MTIPVALTISFLTHKDIELGLDFLQLTQMCLTLVTCMLTFGTGSTNYLQGVVHLMLFVSYIFLIFDGGGESPRPCVRAGPRPELNPLAALATSTSVTAVHRGPMSHSTSPLLLLQY